MSARLRWLFEAKFGDIVLPSTHVKVSARPPEDSKTFTTTIFDTPSTDPDYPLWKILAFCYALSDEVNPRPEFIGGDGLLKLYGFCYPNPLPPDPKFPMGIGRLGDVEMKCIEEWEFSGLFASKVNFGELDHSSNDSCEVVVEWRYSELTYRNLYAPKADQNP